MSVQLNYLKAEIDKLKADFDAHVAHTKGQVEGMAGAVKHAVEEVAGLRTHVEHLTAQGATHTLKQATAEELATETKVVSPAPAQTKAAPTPAATT